MSLIALEKLMLNSKDTYGITINPASQNYELPPDQQFPVSYSQFIKEISEFKSLFPYIELYPEFSPARETKYYHHDLQLPRLHFHGICKVDHKEYYFNGGFQKFAQDRHFFIQSKHDESYYLKNAEIMAEQCEFYNLPYPFTWDYKSSRIPRKILLESIDKWAERAKLTLREEFQPELLDNGIQDLLL